MLASSVVPLPIDRVIVERIDPSKTASGALSYLITAHTADEASRHVQYQTMRVLDAAACQRSLDLGIPVRIRWKQTEFGRDITRVEIER